MGEEENGNPERKSGKREKRKPGAFHRSPAIIT
jgi:hypothetical protein